jgi:peptidoglycan hydrolase-like protein with peptidoglycan-binding domain
MIFLYAGFADDAPWNLTHLQAQQAPELQHDRQLVREIQVKLAEQGYYAGAIDGIIGPQTRDALRNFQRAHRLPVSGHLDEATVAKLGVNLDEEQEEGKGIFRRIGSGAKKVTQAVSKGATTGAKATKKGAITGAEATAEGATATAKATAKGASEAGKKTAEVSTTAAEATGKGVSTAGRAVKNVFSGKRSDEQILYDIQDKFKQDPEVDPTHFDIGVSDGTVTLTLRAGNRSELLRAADLAKQVDGVKGVVTREK